MRLAIVTNILAPYRVPLLNRVAATDDVELKAFLAAEREPGRHWTWFEDIDFECEIRKPLSWRGPRGFVRHVDLGLVGAVARWKPDIVLAGGTATIALLGLAASRAANCPFVWWVDATAESDAAMSYAWLLPVKRLLAARSASFLASSTGAREYLGSLGADEAHVHQSLLGIDAPAFRRSVDLWRQRRDEVMTELGIDSPVVLYVGQLEPYKGVDLLLDACARLRGAEAVHVLLVGAGSLEDSLRQQADSLGVRTTFVGFVQQEELPRFYSIADVFCLMSRFEPFGVVVAEAVAAGVPVVCSRHAGASRDLVIDGESGFVVEPSDATRVSDCIREVTLYPEVAERMSAESVGVARRLDVGSAAAGILAAARDAASQVPRKSP